MAENKNKQSAYGTLKNLINDPTQKRVFGSGGLFGYRRENHKVLEIFASYAYWEIKDDGSVPVTLDSEHFVNYLKNLTELSSEEKEKIIKKIENLRQEGAIKDQPLAENTLRNFAVLLGDLEIGGNPELIGMQYEDALDKAITFQIPTGAGGNVPEAQSATGTKNPEKTASQPIPGTEKSASESQAGKSEMETAAKIENKDQTKIELKKEEQTKETEETADNYQPPSGRMDPEQKQSEKEKKPEKTEKPEVKTDIPVKKEDEKLAAEKTEQESEDTELKSERVIEKTAATKPIMPVYQRLIFNRPQTGKTGKFAKPARISQMESTLGTLRRASKAQTGPKDKSRQTQEAGAETPKDQTVPQFKDIPIIPLAKRGSSGAGQAPAVRRSSGPSSARRLAKLAGAGVGGGSILPFFAGGGHAEAATFTGNYLEKLLKFLF